MERTVDNTIATNHQRDFHSGGANVNGGCETINKKADPSINEMRWILTAAVFEIDESKGISIQGGKA